MDELVHTRKIRVLEQPVLTSEQFGFGANFLITHAILDAIIFCFDKSFTALLLLDLAKAFDTDNHILQNLNII